MRWPLHRAEQEESPESGLEGRQPFDQLRLFHILRDEVGWSDEASRALTEALAQRPWDTLAIRDILVLHGGFSEETAHAFIYKGFGIKRLDSVEALLGGETH